MLSLKSLKTHHPPQSLKSQPEPWQYRLGGTPPYIQEYSKIAEILSRICSLLVFASLFASSDI